MLPPPSPTAVQVGEALDARRTPALALTDARTARRIRLLAAEIFDRDHVRGTVRR